jgi:cytochrome b561
MLKSGPNHWGSVAKFFHWTIVVLILAQGAIGLIMVELPKRPNVIPVFSFHKSLGLTILALAVLRLAWRLFDPRPQEPATMPRWQALGARAGTCAAISADFSRAAVGLVVRFGGLAAAAVLVGSGPCAAAGWTRSVRSRSEGHRRRAPRDSCSGS